MDIRADLVYGHTGYDFISHFRSTFSEILKTAKNAASDGFGSNFSGAAFYLPSQLVGILLSYLAGSKIVSARPSAHPTRIR